MESCLSLDFPRFLQSQLPVIHRIVAMYSRRQNVVRPLYLQTMSTQQHCPTYYHIYWCNIFTASYYSYKQPLFLSAWPETILSLQLFVYFLSLLMEAWRTHRLCEYYHRLPRIIFTGYGNTIWNFCFFYADILNFLLCIYIYLFCTSLHVS